MLASDSSSESLRDFNFALCPSELTAVEQFLRVCSFPGPFPWLGGGSGKGPGIG